MRYLMARRRGDNYGRDTTRCIGSERPSWRLVIRFKWYVWLLALVPGLAVIVAALTGILDSNFLDTRASVILSGLALTFGALAVLGVLSRPWRVTSLWQRIVAIGGTALTVLAAVVVASAAFGTIQEELFGTTVQGVRGVALFDTGLIAVGTDDAGHVAVWVSPDGESWDRADHSEALGGVDVSDVTVFGEQILVVGQGTDTGEDVVLTSSDGWVWNRSPVFGDNLNPESGIEMTRLLEDLADNAAWQPRAIANTNGLLAMVGDTYGNAVVFWQSTDAVTWTVADPLPVFDRGDEIVDVVAWKGGFVAVGSDGAGGPQVWISEAATAWTLQDAQLDGQSLVAAATEDAVVVIANAGSGATVSATTDGVSWTHHDSDVFLGHRVDAIVSSPAGFAAVGADTSTGDISLWTSSDGAAWTVFSHHAESADIEIHDIVPFGTSFVAVGYDEVSHTAALWIVNDRSTWRRIVLDPVVATLE